MLWIGECGFQAAFIRRDEAKPHAAAMLAELRARGIKEGMTVHIGDMAFDYQD